MCILSYVPTKDGFVLTFNRDEVFSRKTKAPDHYTIDDQQLVFPKDTKYGGSWIGINETRSVVGCMLNAKGKSPKIPSKSRGVIFIDNLIRGGVNLNENELCHIAPFTLLFFYVQSQVVVKYYWDGIDLKRENNPMSSPLVLCSSSLYTEAIISELREEFKNQISDKSEVENTTSSFHKKCLFYKNHPIYLKKNSDIQTVSITTILKNKKGFTLTYADLQENTEQTIPL